MALRVAAYCRVSTDKEDQLHSLEAQRRFFQSYIREQPDWTLVGVFADEGLSGTSLKRPAFSRLLQLAYGGKLDLILTKEVSRFARNTVDALRVTRSLRARGVGVRFLSDGIDTRDNDGEFRLTILASVAQEESRKISERTRWGQTQAMKRGVVFGNDTLYGYALRKGQLTPRPEQAAVVRHIYSAFLEGKGTCVLARELNQAGAPPPTASGAWSSTMVLRVLRNEKYTGDLLQKKYRTLNHLSHKKVPNDGAEPQFRLENHHPAVISRSVFQAAQRELERRHALAQGQRRHSAAHWYSGRVVCGCCGKSYTPKRTRRPGGGEYCRLVCRGRYGEGPCPSPALRPQVLAACLAYLLGALGLDEARSAAAALRQARREGLCPPTGAEEALSRSDALWDAALGSCTVFPDGLLLRLREIPHLFFMEARGVGRGKDYRVELSHIKIVPAP